MISSGYNIILSVLVRRPVCSTFYLAILEIFKKGTIKNAVDWTILCHC